MPAEASIRFRAESQQARREIQTLRGTLAQLNKTLAEQRNQLIGATAEEQKNIRAHIAANNALKTTIRSQIEQTNLRKQAIAQTQREAKERERLAQQQVREAQRVGKAQEQAARRASAAQSALIADLTIGARVVYQELSRLTTGFVGAAANMETFRNSVQAVTGDATETNRILADLLQLTVELVGIDTGTLISYAGRLMATGLSAEEAITAIRGVTERVAEQGKAASVTARVMEQVTQSFNAGIATMQDFRPILREMPTFWRDASNALGTNITNLEDFRQAADAAGGNTQALLLVLEEMGRVSLGANLDTLNAQIDILQDQSQLLAAELGEHLVPAIVSIVKEVNVWIERFRNMDDRAQAAIAWSVALTTALAGLGAIVGTATLGFGALSASLGALTGAAGIAGVAAGFGGLTAALAAAAPYIAVGGVIIAGIALLAKAINDTSESAQVLRTEITRLDAVTRVYNLTTGQLEEITGDQADAFAQFQQRVKNAQGDVANITNLLQQNRIEQEALTTAMAKASGDAIPELQNQLKSLTAEEQELSQALDDATDKLQNLRFEVVPDDAELTAPIESLEEQLIRAADQVIRLQGAFREVSRGDDIQSIEEAASNLTAALDRELSIQLMNAELTAAERLDLELTHAREVEGVTTDTQNRIREIAKETTEAQAEAVERQTDAQIASAARARSAEVARWEAAAAAGASYAEQLSEIGSPEQRQRFVQIVEQLQDQGLTFEQARAEAARYIPILAAVSKAIIQQTQDAEALADVLSNLAQRTDTHNAALVNPAISDAAENMRLYIREMGTLQNRFEGVDAISDRLTDSIRDQASAFDELRSSVAGVSQAQSGLQGQQLGSGVFDQFQARTPGSDFGTSFADNLRPLQAQIGQELGSQAIRTAGELKRIEQDRVESLEDLEREYSEQIIAINEEKRQKLAEVEQAIEAERVRRLASIEEAFEDAKNAEIEARQEAADRILVIEQKAAEDRQRLRERLNDRLIALEQRRDDRIQDLTDGFIEREQDRQQEVLEITERAADARVEAEQAYAAEVQSINNRLVEDVLALQRELAEEIESLESGFVQRHADRADEIVRITQEAADARSAANETFTDTMEGIYNDLVTAWDALEEGFTERQADRAEERIDIEARAADARVDAYETYNNTVAKISTDLVNEIRDIQDEITEVITDAAETRLEIEQESIEDRAEANADYARRVEAIEADRDRQLEDSQRRLAEIQQQATDARLTADEDYANRFQDIQNDLVDRVVSIQRTLNDTLNDLRNEQLDAERERAESLVDLHEETQQKLEDLERSRTQTLEDLRREFQRDQLDAAARLDRDLEDADSDEEREEARKRYQRRIADLTRDFHQDQLDLQTRHRRQQENIARQAAESEVQIAERAQAEKDRIAQQQVDARSQAQEGIAGAESAAGIAFQEAQANYVPALSTHEQALLAHAEALDRINQESVAATEAVEQSISEALQTALDDTAAAAQTLSETLSAVTSAEQERLAALESETSGTLTGLNQQITAAETQTGLSFDEALANYTPAVDLNTQALQALTDALQRAESDRVSGLGAVDAAGIADRATTTEAQQALVTGAGVSIEDARANFVPALSSAAQATLTLNETMRELDTSFREAIAEIQETGRVDRQATDAAIQEAVDAAVARQTALETDAGTTFADASAAFQPGVSDIAQATLDRDTAITGIDDSEISDIDSVNAQSLADRLETDAAITEARDVYIKARDAEILKHNTAILQLNIAEAADIKAVRATLSKNLESIDDKLDTELAEIRETKIVFDTRMNELITAINAEANQDITGLKADTAAMRSSLEAIAADARDNAWKEALLKMANVGITVAGVAAGTALGNPVAGLAAGQAVGGLVEQAGNELFHFPRTDVISRQVARADTLRRSRQTPNYLPDANQIRNARDLSREIVAGVNEGLSIGNRGGGIGAQQLQSRFPVDNEELRADITLEFPDGTIQELNNQMLRLKQQDRA